MGLKKTSNLEQIRRSLMGLSGFCDTPGHFLGFKSLTSAVHLACGFGSQTSLMLTKDLISKGMVSKLGGVYIVMRVK